VVGDVLLWRRCRGGSFAVVPVSVLSLVSAATSVGGSVPAGLAYCSRFAATISIVYRYCCLVVVGYWLRLLLLLLVGCRATRLPPVVVAMPLLVVVVIVGCRCNRSPRRRWLLPLLLLAVAVVVAAVVGAVAAANH
jgi:hypothetical protein